MLLSELLATALSKASKALSLPTVDDVAQELVQASLKDLTELQSRVAALSLFSPNETLDDIGSKDLVYIFIPYVLSEVYGRVKTTEREERVQVLEQAQRYLGNFLFVLENYEVVTETDRSLYRQGTSIISDAMQRREIKIKQYQREKELRAKLEVIRERRALSTVDSEGHNDFDLISMLLSTGYQSHLSDEDESLDPDTEDTMREMTLLLLRLMYMQAKNHMENMGQEQELLKSAPQTLSLGRGSEEEAHREQRRTMEEDSWRLDTRPSKHGPDSMSPLLNSSGKPLRPFTILPSEASSRARLQSQVFGASHRLPTMTVDEYLEIERQRGNILTGGGRESHEAPTSTEKLTLASESDGTQEGEASAEELRQKQDKWAQFTDANPRGAGNTMSRG